MVSVSVSVSNAGASGSTPTQNGTASKSFDRRGNAYPSNITGNRIVNAETGVTTDYRVGSLDEYLFFKVADSTRRNSNGDADIYFYDSPEHYLRHRFSRVRYSTKSRSGSAKREKLDKERKDELLTNAENAMVHWDLVDSRGAPVDNFARAYMQPRINPAYQAMWTARRANRLNLLTVIGDDE
jgi:hypothetical protein